MSTTATTAERSQPLPPNADAVESIYSKVSWRIIPLLLISYMVAYLDRINIGYAQLQMKQTLPFGDAVYGIGAGIFFVGYFLFEVPSNLLLERIGARKTLLRIMVLWGLTAAAMMFVTTPTQFYIARFLLGVFEAGFFPGIILYFTYWYPSVRRGQVIAIFMSATTIISVIAGPLCGAILKYFDGMNGWAGWQWLFLVQVCRPRYWASSSSSICRTSRPMQTGCRRARKTCSGTIWNTTKRTSKAKPKARSAR
jgi:MFS family permease